MKYQTCCYVNNRIVRDDIDTEIFKKIKEARAACLFALELEEMFALLFDNFAEFEVELLRLAEFSLLWPEQAYNYTQLMPQRLLLDRRLVNLLSSCRLYIDQSDHGLSRLFGKPSVEFTSIAKFKNELYDSHLGYRLMETLRNHIQHSGLATRSITVSTSCIDGERSSYIEFTVSPVAVVKNLAEDPIFKSNVLEELRQIGEDIDIRGPLRKYIFCFIALHDRLREVISRKVIDARIVYESAVKKYSIHDGDTVKLCSLHEYSDSEELIDEIPLVTKFMDYYDDLQKRNTVNHNLHHCAASNTDQKKGTAMPLIFCMNK